MNQMAFQSQAQPVAPLLGGAVQWGYVVRDLEAAMRHWTEVLKVGPFIAIADFGKTEARYKGKPTDVKLICAFSYVGDIQIELIQQLNDAPSPYMDFLAAGREGLQHHGFWVEDHEGTRVKLEAFREDQPRGGLTGRTALSGDEPR